MQTAGLAQLHSAEAGQRAVDIKRNAYMARLNTCIGTEHLITCLAGRTRTLSCRTLDAFPSCSPLIGGQWFAAQKKLYWVWSLWLQKGGISFLTLGNSYNALTPGLAELRMTDDGLK